MILHGGYQGDVEGLSLWMSWASESAKFEEKERHYKWETFGKTDSAKLGLGALFRLADEALYGD